LLKGGGEEDDEYSFPAAWRRRSVELSTNQYFLLSDANDTLNKMAVSSARTLSIKELSVQVPGERLFF